MFFFVSHSLFVQPVLTDCRVVNGPQKAPQDVVKTRSENIYLYFQPKLADFFFFFKKSDITLNVCYARWVPGDAVWVSNLSEERMDTNFPYRHTVCCTKFDTSLFISLLLL